MSSLPENVKIDIVAATQQMQFIFLRMREYFEGMAKVWATWFPVISSVHRDTVRSVHTAYRRRQKARRRRKRG